MPKFQSAKVYVFDFHFDSDSKEDIAKRKELLDSYFDVSRANLQSQHGDIAEVFLRKH